MTAEVMISIFMVGVAYLFTVGLIWMVAYKVGYNNALHDIEQVRKELERKK